MADVTNNVLDDLEIIRAKASFVLYDDSGSDYSVVRYTYVDEDGSDSGKGQFTATGYCLRKEKGLVVDLYGTWEFSNKYNQNQFKVQATDVPRPTTRRAAMKYLCSLHCGIGSNKAGKLYDRFGESLWNIIDHEPERLSEVPGISEKSVRKMVERMQEEKVQWTLMRLFQGKLDITPEKIRKLREYFKDATIEVAETKPYLLCRVKGFSFPAVDRYAQAIGFDKFHKDRFFAAIPYVFEIYAAKGHVCVPKDDILRALISVLGMKKNEGADVEMVKMRLNDACKARIVRTSNGFLYSNNRYVQETDIVSRIKAISTTKAKDNIKPGMVEDCIKNFEKASGMELAENQRNSILMVFQNKVSVITGGPGTGKSTITKAIIDVYESIHSNEKNPIPPVLLAPTGRAARRLSEVTMHTATTIHSAVKYRGDEEVLEGFHPEFLEGKLFIIDESSMMDQFICSALLNAVPDEARIVFVGDPDQLPSVGCGNVLQDMIDSAAIAVCKLDIIYRQAEGNPIILNSHKVNAGDTQLDFTHSGFKMIEEPTEYETIVAAMNLYLKSVKAYGIDNVILLNPCRNPKYQINLGVLNNTLQKELNPPRDDMMSMKIGDTYFRPNDRIMQMKNTDFAKNGDIGVIHNIVRHPDPDDFERWIYVAEVEFNNDGNIMEYTTEDLKHVDLAYCTSVHKSQGSQYNTVIMIVTKEHEFLLRRCLVYTGLTRAQEHVAIVGQTETLKKAILDDRRDKRHTLLKYRLAEALRNT